MASVDWKKIKSSQEAKSMFRHCVTDERLKHKHANAEIDKTRTEKNMSFGAFTSYEEACKKFDEIIAELDNTEPQRVLDKNGKERTLKPNKRKDRVVAFGWSIPAPAGLRDEEQIKEWATKVYDRFDKEATLVGGVLHLDEIHSYIDRDGNEIDSRAHLHIYAVPVEEKENIKGETFKRLNGAQFSTKQDMIQANNIVHGISKALGVDFLTGEGVKSTDTVERMKYASKIRKAKREADNIIKEAEKASQKLSEANKDKERTLAFQQAEHKKQVQDFNNKVKTYNEKVTLYTKKKNELEQKESSLDKRESELDTREQNFIAQATAKAQAERERILANAEAEAEAKKEEYKKEVQDKERATIRKQEQARAEKTWKDWAREQVDKAIEEVNRKAKSKWIRNGSGKVLHQYVQKAIRFRDKLLENLNNSPVVTQDMKDDLQYASDNAEKQQIIFDTAFDPIAVKKDDFDFDF